MVCWFHHRTIATSGWLIRMIDKVPHVKAPAWLHGDGQWHPATSSPTRQNERLKREQRQQQRGEPEKPQDNREDSAA